MPSLDVHSGSLEHRTVDLSGFRVTHSRFPAGMASRVHDHPRAVLAVTLTGRFEHRTPKGRPDSTTASAHVKPAGEPHANRVGTVPSRVVSIEPDPGTLGRLGPARTVFERRRAVGDPRLGELGWRLAAELEGPDDLWSLAAEGLILEMLTLAGRGVASERRPRPVWLPRLLEILHERFAESPTIADLAALVDVDEREMAARFREHLHVPIGAYVRRLRLDWARERLAGSDAPISSIALRAGYADQSHLTREMRKRLGVTPAAYRRAAGR